METSLSQLWEIVTDREACSTAVHGITKSDTTSQLNSNNNAVYWGFSGGSVIKNPPAMQKTQETQETWVQSLGWEDT